MPTIPTFPIASALSASLCRLVDHFYKDERCLAMYLWGSLAEGTADAHSDVDVAAVFLDDAYPAVREMLRPVCEKLCGPITVWLPEGERPDRGNYAFLFEEGGHQHLCDFTIMSAAAFRRSGVDSIRVLFEKEKIVSSMPSKGSAPSFDESTLAGIIDKYWVYAFLHGKYGRRDDLYKMLYVQSALFAAHLRVINALHPEREWRWWGRDAGRLDATRRHELASYFGARTVPAISQALLTVFDLFARDARQACERTGTRYPESLESAVRRHLATIFVWQGTAG